VADDDLQATFDTLYMKVGPCCAGCDWWHHVSARAGECYRSAPVEGRERFAVIGIERCSMPLSAGHIFTPPEHRCGEFKDEFDWSSLPLPYRKRIGDRTLGGGRP
jgi:hypothetical protein